MALNSLLNENLLQNYLIKTPRYLAIQRHYFWVHMPQCGILGIFMYFIFYVKSLLANLEHQKTANSTITTFQYGKVVKNTITIFAENSENSTFFPSNQRFTKEFTKELISRKYLSMIAF